MFRTKFLICSKIVSIVAVLVTILSPLAADRDAVKANPLLGGWDLTVSDGNHQYPSWLQIRLSGYRTLVGEYVGQFGSVRPISKIDFDTNTTAFRFVVPPQWERRTNDIVVEGKLEGDSLSGTVPNDSGKPVPFQGKRAPFLVREHAPKWGKSIDLFNGHDLNGWKARNPNAKNGWRVENGFLRNASPGNDIMTERDFTDFKLHAEFRYPNGANSGIYLRGRYEVQIEDDFGLEPDSHFIGGVYGFLTPRVNAAKKTRRMANPRHHPRRSRCHHRSKRRTHHRTPGHSRHHRRRPRQPRRTSRPSFNSR